MKHTVTKQYTKKASFVSQKEKTGKSNLDTADKRQSARLKASIDLVSEPAKNVDTSSGDFESSSQDVVEKVTTTSKSKKFIVKSIPSYQQ